MVVMLVVVMLLSVVVATVFVRVAAGTYSDSIVTGFLVGLVILMGVGRVLTVARVPRVYICTGYY